jgi:hypothetical protein
MAGSYFNNMPRLLQPGSGSLLWGGVYSSGVGQGAAHVAVGDGIHQAIIDVSARPNYDDTSTGFVDVQGFVW